jgi:hypothetical protein
MLTNCPRFVPAPHQPVECNRARRSPALPSPSARLRCLISARDERFYVIHTLHLHQNPSSNPSSRCLRNRARQFVTVCGVTPSVAATTLFLVPLAQPRTMRERLEPSCADATKPATARVPLQSTPTPLSVDLSSRLRRIESTIRRTTQRSINSMDF